MRPYREAYGIEPTRTEQEIARAKLEELADQGEAQGSFPDFCDSERLTQSSLTQSLFVLGFGKEGLLSEGYKPVIYLRKNQGNLEVLADHDLANHDLRIKIRRIERVPFLARKEHLYHIPASQDVREWYESIHNHNIHNHNFEDLEQKRRKDTESIILLYSAAAYVLALETAMIWNSWAGPLVAVAGSCIAAVASIRANYHQYKIKIPDLEKQLIAKGPDALRYIAKNSNPISSAESL